MNMTRIEISWRSRRNEPWGVCFGSYSRLYIRRRRHAETESTQDDQFHVLIINGLTRCALVILVMATARHEDWLTTDS
jgi:hypothetical protein